MTPELEAAIEKARGHKMTAREKFEQRVSFVYGQQDHDKPGKSKDEIRKMLADNGGWPLEELAEAADEIAALRDRVAALEAGAAGLEKAIDEFMGDLHTRASWDKHNIDEDGVVTLPCGNGVLYRLREARAILATP